MPRGGKREGAGKPKGRKDNATIAREMMREVLREMVKENLDSMVRAQIEKSNGVLVQKVEAGVQKIYSIPPDPQAFKNLIEQSVGKPTQSIEGTGDNGEFIFKWQQPS